MVAPKDKQRDRYAPLPGDSQALGQWRERMGTDAAKLIYNERAASIECTNAHLRNRSLQRFNVRGLIKARAVLPLHALAHNLKRMMALNFAFAFDDLSLLDVAGMLGNARALKRATEAGTLAPLLRGKKFGLLCHGRNAIDSAHSTDATDAIAAELFRRAATELGAHVAHIRPSLSALSTSLEVQHPARMLGLLYDAVECQGMPGDLVQQLADAAGIPFFDGIATHHHPTALFAHLMGGDTPDADNRRYLLQATLLSSLS